ncbi:MAG TPA: hypothetical protein PK466_08865 [Thermotogota bacterium]|nr:hypothetical protein [Thermotogota bacterium]HPJ89280.1 hypothetical protein [Thermotogota bacterium]HPR96428.1 hypothetical protein [Thermotogota bacterium]
MSEAYRQKIEEIKGHIESSIENSEMLAKQVYESLPKFEEEILTSVEFINEFLEQLTQSEAVNEDDSFISRLGLLRTGVTSSLKNVTTLIDAVEQIFRKVFKSEDVSSDESFVEIIIKEAGKVEESLEDLNSVALNSSITSSQLGVEGGAFSVLSKEVERQTQMLVRHFHNIDDIISSSFPNIVFFRETINRFTEFSSLRGNFTRLMDRFESVEDALKILQLRMKKGVDAASKSFPDIMAHMVGQDIFRQQMEHIMDFFTDMESRQFDYTKNTKDELSFLKFVLEVTEDIVEDSRMEFSSVFSRVVTEFDQFVDNIETSISEPSREFALYFLEANESSLYRTIQEVMIITVKNTVFMGDVLEGLSNLRESLYNFGDNIKALGLEVSNAMTIVKRFKTMNILIKAELSRIEDKMGKKAEGIRLEFDEAIDKVTSTTQRLDRVTKNILNTYKSNRDTFENFRACSTELIQKDELRDIFTGLEKLVKNIESSYTKMMDRFNASMAIINDVQLQFEKNVQRIESENEAIYLEITEFEKSVPAYSSEFLQNEELKALSEKFTTYRERLKASDHMDIDDIGSDGGEFTLF